MSHQQYLQVLEETDGGPGITWSDLRKNRPIKQKSNVVAAAAAAAAVVVVVVVHAVVLSSS